MASVSIIIPAYNSSATIGEALDSVAAQTVGDCETIVVDDCSTDDTVPAVERWIAGRKGGDGGAGDPRLRNRWRLVRLDANSGPAGARNRGIAEARGEWLAFLDADDAWLPCRLATQLRAAEAHPEIALWCGRAVPMEEGEIPAGGRLDAGNAEGREAAPAAAGAVRRIALDEFARHNPVATSTVLVRRQAVSSAGGFDTRFRGPEDYDLWMRVAARFAVALLDVPVARYRYRPGSLSMDDRRFLHEVLGVIEKAFSPQGALAGHGHLRRRAEATQYWNASWMAFNRGSRGGALRHLFAALARDPLVGGGRALPLLWRYLFGRAMTARQAERS